MQLKINNNKTYAWMGNIVAQLMVNLDLHRNSIYLFIYN